MRLGITPPLFTMTPNGHAPWEVDAAFDEVVPLVEAADRLGYEYVTCSEHVIIPDDVAKVRGGRYWDPLATFGYLAARTERIRFATYVLVLGYHHPLAIAKRYGTLDRISNGRLILGVGVGTLQEEFELLGADFPDRGARGRRRPACAPDQLRSPAARISRRVLRLRGGAGGSLRRAADGPALDRRSDGAVPAPGGRARRRLGAVRALDRRRDRALLERVRSTDGWARRQEATDLPPFEVVLPVGRLLDPLDDPDAAQQALRAQAGIGATMVNVGFRHRSPQHYVEQLEALVPIAEAV